MPRTTEAAAAEVAQAEDLAAAADEGVTATARRAPAASAEAPAATGPWHGPTPVPTAFVLPSVARAAAAAREAAAASAAAADPTSRRHPHNVNMQLTFNQPSEVPIRDSSSTGSNLLAAGGRQTAPFPAGPVSATFILLKELFSRDQTIRDILSVARVLKTKVALIQAVHRFFHHWASLCPGPGHCPVLEGHGGAEP
jgi:hypothetical protein